MTAEARSTTRRLAMSLVQRRTLALAAALAAVVTLAPGPARGADPVRLGYLGPLTGVLAQTGKEMQEGFQFLFEQAGHQCGSRRVDIVVEDSEGNPNAALTKLRKLVDRDRIAALAGIQWANIGYAIAPIVDRERLPVLMLTTPDDLTKRRPAKFITRVSAPASQVTHPLGEYARKVLGYKRAATIAMDLAFGHESVAGFQRVFEEHGGEVVQKLWTPAVNLDFASYLSQIRRDVDVVFSTFAAAPAARFIKQYDEYGLKARIPLIATGYQTDEAVLRTLGDEAVGIVSALYWTPTLETPASQAFVKTFVGKFGKTPSVYHMSMYSGAKWLCEALRATEGKGDDPVQLLNAIRQASQTVEDPRGPIRIDEYGNPTQNVYILRVERKDGQLQNRVVHTYPMVSQFWTYKPADFLKEPAYSRSHPPVRGQ
jgi:branched-chain amino acid transport system substrate-binding protein